MKVMGLMSGTSLDGIDAALLEIEGREVEDLHWSVLAFHTRPFSAEERHLIQGCLAGGGPRDLALLHVRLGESFASAALELLNRAGLGPEAVTALGSHGQTVWHEPPDRGHRGASLQLGCPATLAERTGVGVVSDFRARDLAAGGHGAPLVPWADRILFSSPAGPRAIQNLGGMANVTWLPASTDPAPLLAFDTGPGVALMNTAVEMATDGRMAWDEDGRMADRGRVSEPVLDRLLDRAFFRSPPPRSTGRELFGPGLVEEAVKALEAQGGVELRPGIPGQGWDDLLATLTALTARSVGDAYRRWVIPKGVAEVFLTGGGARNPALFQAIASELSPLVVRSGEALGLNPDAREAAAFAILAWAHLQGIPANVPEATGSEGPRVLGSWTPGVRRRGP